MAPGSTVVHDEPREKWKHEDNLINHRITWLFVSQTLLLGGYGLLLQVRSANPPDDVLPKVNRLIDCLPWVGFVTSVLILVGVLAAGIALSILRAQNKGPRVDVSLLTSVMGWFSACGLPVVFVVVWLVLLWP